MATRVASRRLPKHGYSLPEPEYRADTPSQETASLPQLSRRQYVKSAPFFLE